MQVRTLKLDDDLVGFYEFYTEYRCKNVYTVEGKATAFGRNVVGEIKAVKITYGSSYRWFAIEKVVFFDDGKEKVK